MSYTERYTREELQAILTRLGSWKKFQDVLGLTSSELLESKKSLSLTVLDKWNAYDFESKLRRIGSIRTFCLAYGCKEYEARKLCAEYGIDVKLLSSPTGNKTGAGRKGELYFKQRMGDRILEDCFESRSHQAPFDFRVQGYGLVNVKTSRRKRYKASTRKDDPNHWDFNLSGMNDCDYFAFVPLDHKGQPMTVMMVDSKALSSFLMGASQFRMTGKAISRLPRNVIPIAIFGMNEIQWIQEPRTELSALSNV